MSLKLIYFKMRALAEAPLMLMQCKLLLWLFAVITGGNIEWTLNLPATIIA